MNVCCAAETRAPEITKKSLRKNAARRIFVPDWPRSWSLLGYNLPQAEYPRQVGSVDILEKSLLFKSVILSGGECPSRRTRGCLGCPCCTRHSLKTLSGEVTILRGDINKPGVAS